MASESAFCIGPEGEYHAEENIDWTENIAAELDSILAHISYVKCNANSRLDGPENQELFLAWQKTAYLASALRT